MELYLQFGHGMMGHCRELVARWEGGTVVLSPRDLDSGQLDRLADDITKHPNGRVLLDPQFYLPHASHERLRSHFYWPDEYDTGTFWDGPRLALLISELLSENRRLATDRFILPGVLANEVNEDWIAIHSLILEEARAQSRDIPILMTIALSADAARNNEQIALLMDRSEAWTDTGFYLVWEHPRGDYLTTDPNWLANLLDVCAGLRLRNSEVVIGYCNHQMLIASAAGVNAICSGTWMNVRSFPPEKFQQVHEDEIRQRTTWYYCPQALSEFTIPFLDLAQNTQVLATMQPPASMESEFVSPLFTGAQPSSIGLGEQQAFRHYLHCLREQITDTASVSFDSAVEEHQQALADAEQVLAVLHTAGIHGNKRDFGDIVAVNNGALAALVQNRGPLLRRNWDQLH